MNKFLRRGFLVFFLIGFLLGGCGSSKKKPHGKLKPGKPIPCPLKDC
jgi:uncharacterized protein YceK